MRADGSYTSKDVYFENRKWKRNGDKTNDTN